MTNNYDLVVIGAGSAGITAAQFAARLGVKVALVEKNRVGGDCTWTGCVPSKALLKAAKIAHAARTAHQYGICTNGDTSPKADMAQVQNYVQQAITRIYQHETPDHLTQDGIQIIHGAAHFLDAHNITVGEQTLRAKKFIIATGAHPIIPNIPGLSKIPYITYLQLFENSHLPERLVVIGAGPIGAEIAQAYQRLGSQVTLIDVDLLPAEEPEVCQTMGRVFAKEGIRLVKGLVTLVQQVDDEIVLHVDQQEIRGDMVLVAVGRRPVVGGLNLIAARVEHSPDGILVDKNLRTSVKHIYAVGDCVAGNEQFTHLAGWQGYKATRNALLPLNETGFTNVLPRTTFTDPEVAHVGQTEAEARQKFGDSLGVTLWGLDRVDRAVVENDNEGFIKVVHKKNGKILGATIVAERAGEMITEYALAIERGLKLMDLANVIHVYPSYSMGTMRLAARAATDQVMNNVTGTILRRLAGGQK